MIYSSDSMYREYIIQQNTFNPTINAQLFFFSLIEFVLFKGLFFVLFLGGIQPSLFFYMHCYIHVHANLHMFYKHLGENLTPTYTCILKVFIWQTYLMTYATEDWVSSVQTLILLNQTGYGSRRDGVGSPFIGFVFRIRARSGRK